MTATPTLWREVDALRSEVRDHLDQAYADALEDVTAILERRGFTEQADAGAEVVRLAEEMAVTQTIRGFAVARGVDHYESPWSVQDSSLATDDCIWLGSEGADGGRAHLTRDQVASLIPLLQRFVDTGTIARLALAKAGISPADYEGGE